ncbi:MFS transporter [Sphingomonas sp. Leaf23]|uniref:MFS transporter n=1 Tax=Sphingomonas sp. Leaf23 TaxID=1735689 RepID=UPI0006FE7D81|nr:MFS transporter [Sphingomonas sp. Leaf23]KQM85598.1 MFS transporter [Sphingomonas sp. Leaf23]
MVSHDPRIAIDQAPMSRFQWGIVATMVGLNALDGFDVLSISFASPGIAADWGIDRAALGIVLSMELVGMAIGSLFLGGVADRLGRRTTILGCLGMMTIGMLGAASAGGIVALSVWRVATGVGIGGMLASTNAAVAEAANTKHRALAVVLMAAGYPIGTIVGGSVSAVLLAHYDWRAVFVFGAACSALFVPLVLWRAPESVAFLMHRRSPDALARINATLRRMGHGAVDALPDPEPKAVAAKAPVVALFSPALLRTTLALTLAYLAHIMTFYFILKWIPKIVVDMDFPAPQAAGVLVWASIGGATGSLILGLLTGKVRLLALTIGAMLLSTALVIVFGRAQSDLAGLSIVAAAAGFATNAGVVGLYALVAERFPTSARATATGFVIGVGRGGSALAPMVAGFLFAAGYGLQTVAVLMGVGSLVAAVALLLLRGRAAVAVAR